MRKLILFIPFLIVLSFHLAGAVRAQTTCTTVNDGPPCEETTTTEVETTTTVPVTTTTVPVTTTLPVTTVPVITQVVTTVPTTHRVTTTQPVLPRTGNTGVWVVVWALVGLFLGFVAVVHSRPERSQE